MDTRTGELLATTTAEAARPRAEHAEEIIGGYLDAVYDGLRPMPRQRRWELLDRVAERIEALRANELAETDWSLEKLLGVLGAPRQVARLEMEAAGGVPRMRRPRTWRRLAVWSALLMVLTMAGSLALWSSAAEETVNSTWPELHAWSYTHLLQSAVVEQWDGVVVVHTCHVPVTDQGQCQPGDPPVDEVVPWQGDAPAIVAVRLGGIPISIDPQANKQEAVDAWTAFSLLATLALVATLTGVAGLLVTASRAGSIRLPRRRRRKAAEGA